MSRRFRVLDLFSGIGGFSLGLERTGGFETVAFCEIEPFPRRVLAKHWPNVPIYEDVRDLTAERLEADGIGVDVICGGFPCQDISIAGKGAGLEGERSGLWSEIARLSRELRPRYVIVENVGALLHRGIETVLGDLAEIGFDAEWHCIPASAVGAPHQRDRFWMVAYPGCIGIREHSRCEGWLALPDWERDGAVAPCGWPVNEDRPGADGENEPVAYADKRERQSGRSPIRVGWGRFAAEDEEVGLGARAQWATERDVGRVADGVPNRVDRLRALGNAVVPQIPEMIGRAILAAEQHHIATG